MNNYPVDDKNCPPNGENPPEGRKVYTDIISTWMNLGYVVLTAGLDGGKKPAVKWKKHAAGKGRVPEMPSKDELKNWITRFGTTHRGLLILDSHEDPEMRLAVIDIDEHDDKLMEWAIDEVGDTPLVVTSGRGWHLYYRAPVGQYIKSSAKKIGPDWSLNDDGETAIDVKAGGSYVAAPGSWHEGRQRYYSTSVEVTADLIRSLPIFDADKYEAMVKARSRPKGGGGGGGGGTKGSVHIERHEFTRSNVGVVTEAGETGTLGSVGAALGTGDYVQVFCPHHDNKNTPAASLPFWPH